MDTANIRLKLLKEWATKISQASMLGVFTKAKFMPNEIVLVNGPRAGALEISAGLNAGKMLGGLSADDYALHRQFIPWDFIGDPVVFMSGRFVRLEAAWPMGISDRDIPLASIGANPKDVNRWIAGKTETGATLTLSISDTIPHYLFAGITGSGKTVAMRSAIYQLAKFNQNKFVLIDGKYGDGLNIFSNIPNLVGPVVTNQDIDEVRKAIAWVKAEMMRRYSSIHETFDQLILVIDEVQSFVDDQAITGMLADIISQGRGANIHVFLGTQHPTVENVGGAKVKRNLSGRVGLHVNDWKASEVVVGGTSPRLSSLMGAGDAYAIAPNNTLRTQIAYADRRLIEQMNIGRSDFEWPEYSLEDASYSGASFSPIETAISITHAFERKNGINRGGRDLLKEKIRSMTGASIGSPKAGSLRNYGREVFEEIARLGYCISECEEENDS